MTTTETKPYCVDRLQELLGGKEAAIIPGYPEYAATKDGEIWSRKYGRWIKMNPCMSKCRGKQKYLQVLLCRDGGRKNFTVHKCVLLAWRGPAPDDVDSRHLDGNVWNNTLENLVYGTKVENMDDKRRHGRLYRPIGEKNPQAVMSEGQVRAIRAAYDEGGRTQTSIAEEFGISFTLVHKIVRRKRWSHL